VRRSLLPFQRHPVEAAPNDAIYWLAIDVAAADAALDEIAHRLRHLCQSQDR
jgi:hypothetical protein